MTGEAARALCAAIIPAGPRLRGGDERTVASALALVSQRSQLAGRGLSAIAEVLDRAAVLHCGKPLRALDAEGRERAVRRFERDPLLRMPLLLFSLAVRTVHYDDPEIYGALGGKYDRGLATPPVSSGAERRSLGVMPPELEAPRWLSQVTTSEQLDESTLECDVVVIGTGAGGAVVGKELAERGLAVLFLEEGDHHRRDAFTGHARDAHRFYRGNGTLASVGNAVIPIFAGRLVGGSTTINTATCFRTPEWVLAHWCEEVGTDDLSPEALRPHFEAIEQFLEIEDAGAAHLGGPARVLARGCDALGWHHFPVRRNAPGCDGQGVCDFGCPTDAKRSMNLSYVPAALSRGAQMIVGMRATRILVEGGRAVGVEARPTRGGNALSVRARAVVLAGGAIPTPLLLLSQGLCNRSGEVGKNLSLHPATVVSALFDEPIEGYNTIPQGYCSDHLHREGVLLLGASAPIDMGATLLPLNGRRLTEAMEAFDRIASFGVMVEDEARGRVRPNRRGAPLVTYFLGRTEIERLRLGMVALTRIYLAAGARRIHPLLPKLPSLEPREAVDALRNVTLRPWDLQLSSFHPLGTCRMGRDPRRSVVDLDHQSHDLPGLFLIDGSTLPGPPAVNPQLTIMALARRAALRLAERLE